jgi:hypothetical protein
MEYGTNAIGGEADITVHTSGHARELFAQRQTAVHETADYYGIDKHSAVIIGGAALALHGIDSWVPDVVKDIPFDVDAILIQQQGSWRHALRNAVQPSIGVHRDKQAPLHLTMIRGRRAVELAYCGFGETYDTFVANRVMIGGLATPSLDKLVASKAGVGRLKDVVGLIKAHAVAMADGHPVVNTDYWNDTLSALLLQVRSEGEGPRARKYPGWLKHLIATDFDHPSYRTIAPQ